MTAPPPRPRVVTAAFWCWAIAAVMLMVGGLIAASVKLPAPLRVTGVLTVLVGGAVASWPVGFAPAATSDSAAPPSHCRWRPSRWWR